MMVTQKDVHNNIVVNASAWQKRYLSLQCGGNVEKINAFDLCPKCRKDFEEFMRNDR